MQIVQVITKKELCALKFVFINIFKAAKWYK